MKRIRMVATLVGTLALFVGCSDLTDLEVVNQNAPDRDRAIVSPTDVQSLISGAFYRWWNGWEKSYPSMAHSATADEGTMSWGNFSAQQNSSEPRVLYPNEVTWRYNNHVETPWGNAYQALSSVYDAMQAVEGGLAIVDAGGTDNTPRARAFAKFMQGLAHGNLALMYDKAFILDETVDLEAGLDFQPYTAVAAAAQQYLADAITIATANTFTLPPDWINGLTISNTELAGLAHWFMASYLMKTPRNPAERAAVAWGEVVTHLNAAQSMYGQDFKPYGDGNFWWQRIKGLGVNSGWMRADYKSIGFYDTSGNIAAWMAADLNTRTNTEFSTPDDRLQIDGDPQSDGPYVCFDGPSPHRADRGTYHFSMYTWCRYLPYFQNGYIGDMTYFNMEELNLDKAEALWRVASSDLSAVPPQAVIDLINLTRVGNGGMTAITAAAGAAAIKDALFYERRIEAHHLGSGFAFYDRRGLGPLAPTGPNWHHGPVEGTPCHYPVPGSELELLELPIYSFGGVGNECGTTASSGIGGVNERVPASKVYRFTGMSLEEKLASLRDESEALPAGMRQLTRY